MIDYTIVVPSRKRTHNMPTILELLPTAMICVDEREEFEYLNYVPAERLILHPAFDGAPRVRNWLLGELESSCIVFLDDDFVGIKCNTGSKRFLTDSEEILAVIENSIVATSDLGLGVFCWSRTMNLTVINPDMRPVVPTQQIFSGFGVMNKARHRKWREDMQGRADVDYTVRTLFEDRCVYADVRYYFDFGRIYSGRGGAVGLITPDQYLEASKRLKDKWGKYVNFKRKSFFKGDNVETCTITVSRTNKSAQR